MKIICFVLILVLSGCVKKVEKVKTFEGGWFSYDVVVIDGCEYLSRCTGTSSATVCHKGNCRFCRARLDSLISEKMRR